MDVESMLKKLIREIQSCQKCEDFIVLRLNVNP